MPLNAIVDKTSNSICNKDPHKVKIDSKYFDGLSSAESMLKKQKRYPGLAVVRYARNTLCYKMVHFLPGEIARERD